jgi:hypothetical protein
MIILVSRLGTYLDILTIANIEDYTKISRPFPVDALDVLRADPVR